MVASYDGQKFLILMLSTYQSFLLSISALNVFIKRLCLFQGHENISHFPPGALISSFIPRSAVHMQFLFCIWYRVGFKIKFFTGGYKINPAQLIEKTNISALYCSGIFVLSQATVYMWGCIWIFYFVPLVCLCQLLCQYYTLLIAGAHDRCWYLI